MSEMTKEQIEALKMRLNAQAMEIVRLRRIADAAKYPMLFRHGYGVEIYDGLPPDAKFCRPGIGTQSPGIGTGACVSKQAGYT